MFFRLDAASIIKVIVVAAIIFYLGFPYLPSALITAFLLIMHEHFFVDGSAASLKNGLLYIVLGAVIHSAAQYTANQHGLSLEELSKSDIVTITTRTKSMPFLGAASAFSGVLILILAWFSHD